MADGSSSGVGNSGGVDDGDSGSVGFSVGCGGSGGISDNVGGRGRTFVGGWG